MARITACEEACAMAMEMESVGRDFYAALASASDDKKVRAFCALAAGEEGRHHEVFRQMREGFAGAGAGAGRGGQIPPALQDDLRQMVSQQVVPDAGTVRKVAIGGAVEDALAMALDMERDSIRYYEDLAARLPGIAKALRGIVKEEAAHMKSLRSLAGQE